MINYPGHSPQSRLSTLARSYFILDTGVFDILRARCLQGVKIRILLLDPRGQGSESHDQAMNVDSLEQIRDRSRNQPGLEVRLASIQLERNIPRPK